MRKFLKKRGKILALALFLVVGLSACSSPRGTDGKTKYDQIISSEQITLQKSQINVSDISNEEVRKELEKLPEDAEITIEPTSWGQAWSQSWFDGLIVWPLAQLINVIAGVTDAGWGIILTTLLIQMVIFAFTYKSQASSQRMQELQPEMQRIQKKYEGKTDERSKMLMAQETQKLYKDNDINPMGSMLMMFIQLPVMMGMYYATMRAVAVVYGTFMGMSLSVTPMDAFRTLQWGPIAVYILMILFQILNMKLPQWMQKWQQKKDGVKKKKYADKQEGGMMQNSMNMTMYMSTALIGFMYLTWPLAMSFYWMVSSVIRTIQSVFMHYHNVKVAKQREAEKKNRKGKSILDR